MSTVVALKPRPVPEADTPTLSMRLRTETRPCHDRIERNPRFAALTDPELDAGRYRDVMLRLFGFYLPVEADLMRWRHAFPRSIDMPGRIKIGLLRRDLEALGVGPAALAAAPRAKPDLCGRLEAAWGCLYVLEGSTLGGQIIARHLNRSLGLSVEHGASFHLSYGPQIGRRWQEFKAALEAEAEAGALEPDAVVAGAAATFTALDAWMEG